MAFPPILEINPILAADTPQLLIAAMQTVFETYVLQHQHYPQEPALLGLVATTMINISNAQTEYQRRLDELPKKAWNYSRARTTMIEEAKGQFVGMVLGHEKAIADYFWELESEWKWKQLKAQLAELVTKEPAWGMEVLHLWGLKVQDLGGDAACGRGPRQSRRN